MMALCHHSHMRTGRRCSNRRDFGAERLSAREEASLVTLKRLGAHPQAGTRHSGQMSTSRIMLEAEGRWCMR